MEALATYKIPVGWLSDSAVVWLKIHAAWLFAFIRVFLGICLDSTLDFLMNPPFVVPVLLVFAGVLARSYLWRAILVCILLLLVFIDYRWLGSIRPLTVTAIAIIVAFVLLTRRRWKLPQDRLRFAVAIAFLSMAGRFWLESLIPSSFVLISALAVLSWFMHERWPVVLLTIAGFLFVINQGYWEDTMETLSILLWACILCMGIGVPFGILSAHRPRFYRFLRPVLDLMQTLPAFVYLIPALFFFRIGMVPGLITTFIFVLPTPIRLTQAGISSTPKTLLEAAEAFGADRWKLLWKVELPHALPEIRASMTQTIMLSLSMVVITATVGGNGLGVKVYRALQTGNVALGFEAGCVIVVVAIVLDRLFRPGKEG